MRIRCNGLPQYAQTPYGVPQAYTQSPYDVEGLLTYGAVVSQIGPTQVMYE